MSRESKRLKKSSSWLNSGNALIQHLRESAFSRFPVLLGNAEARLIWCGLLKCLLIVYFIGNISAKKYQNPFTSVKVTANQRWGVFLRYGVVPWAYLSPHSKRNLDPFSRFRGTRDRDHATPSVTIGRIYVALRWSLKWFSFCRLRHKVPWRSCSALPVMNLHVTPPINLFAHSSRRSNE